MPAAPTTTEAPSTGKSFAELIPDLAGLAPDNAAPDASTAAADDTTPTPKDEAPPVVPKTDEPKKDEAAPKTDAADPNANPHLDEPEAPKVEKKDAPADDEVPKGMTKKAEETWKTLKAAKKEADALAETRAAEVAALKKQLEEAGKTGPEIERLRKEKEEIAARLAEHENEIAVTRVEATPQYKSQVSAPIKASDDTTKALAAKYEVSAAALLDAIHETDPAKRADMIEDLTADFKLADRLDIVDAAKAYAAATKAGEEMRANASTKLEQLTKEQQREAEQIAAANVSDYRAATEAHWKALQDKYPLIRNVEGKDGWNNYINGKKAAVEGTNINDLPVGDVAEAMLAKEILPEYAKALAHFQKQAKEEREKRLAAEQRLGEYRKTEPGAGTGTTSTQLEESGISKFADIPL